MDSYITKVILSSVLIMAAIWFNIVPAEAAYEQAASSFSSER